MKKLLLSFAVLAMFCGTAHAQSILDRVKDRAKNAVENNIGNKVERGVNDILDGKIGKKKDKSGKNEKAGNGAGWTCEECGAEGNTGKFCNDCGAKRPEGGAAAAWSCPECGKTGNTGNFCDDCGAKKSNEASAKTEAVKSDFVRGEVIMFEDDMKGEQVGEFPSKWDLERGNAEIAKVNGETCIAMIADDSWLTPLVKGGIKNYLGDVFTVEYDMLYKHSNGGPSVELDIMNENENRDNELFQIAYNLYYDKTTVDCDYVRPSQEGFTRKEGNATAHDIMDINDGRWHHFALSFNNRAIKFYIDGKRVINVPNAKPGAGWLTLWVGNGGSENTVYVKNVVIAKGAKELYERNATDIDAKVAAIEKAIAETGKFVTNNILFDTGKATIKPESQAEIDRIADYMKKNPSARFEVQGHTDNQGSDKVNDPLSQQRAEAVVKALEGLGVDGFNLRAVGKGSHEPVADNSTDEGRAKNRRVEFIKK